MLNLFQTKDSVLQVLPPPRCIPRRPWTNGILLCIVLSFLLGRMAASGVSQEPPGMIASIPELAGITAKV